MKKVLTALMVLGMGLLLSGCTIGTDYYSQEETNNLIAEALETHYTQEEVDALVAAQMTLLGPTQIERYIDEMLMFAMIDGELEFIELDTTYTGIVESYSYSTTYIYEALSRTSLLITIETDNDLELCYYPTVIFADDSICEDIKPAGLFSDGIHEFEVTIEAGFFEMDMESWDQELESGYSIILTEVK